MSLKPVIKWALSIGLLWVLYQVVDWEKSYELLKQMKIYPVVVGVLMVIVFEVINAQKIRFIFRDPRLNLKRMTQINFLTRFFNNLAPGGVGGDVLRIYYIGQTIKYNSKAFGGVLIDRLTGFWVQFGLGTIALTVLYGTLWAKGVALVLGVMLLLGGVLFSLYLFPRLIDKIQVVLNWINKRLGWSLKFDGSVKSLLGEVFRNKLLAIKILGIDLVYKNSVNAVVMLLIYGLGYQLSFFEVTLIMFVNATVAMLPISIGGIGVTELSFGYMFHTFGLDSEIGVVISLLIRIVTLPSVLVGWFLFMKERPSIKKNMDVIRKQKRAAHASAVE